MNLSDLAANVLQQQRSTPDLIADALREAILQGVFSEGQSLKQDEIAKQFGVSRIPVREALRQLEAEGLVKLAPNRGATVAVLSPAQAREIGEMRVALETMALRLAIPQLTEGDLQQAAAILAATEEVADMGRWGELNWEFHATLYGKANRPRLLGTIKTLHVNIDRYVRVMMAKLGYQERSQQEHRQFLEACQRRDVEVAVRLLAEHIEAAGVQLVAYLQENQKS